MHNSMAPARTALLLLLLLIAVMARLPTTAALDNGLGDLPPMGWNRSVRCPSFATITTITPGRTRAAIAAC